MACIGCNQQQAAMYPQGYHRAPEFRGGLAGGLAGAGLGDIRADLLAADGTGLTMAAGASVIGSALGGALLGLAASGSGTGAGTGAMLTAGSAATTQGILWAIVGGSSVDGAPISSTLRTIGILEAVIGIGLIGFGGARAYRSYKSGRASR